MFIAHWKMSSVCLCFRFVGILHLLFVFTMCLTCTFKNEQTDFSCIELRNFDNNTSFVLPSVLLRKEVIQPHLPIRLPCYDFTPITNPTFDCCPLPVSSQASGVIGSHGVTGGVYKARERIHRGMLIRDY